MNYETAIAEVQQICGWRSDNATVIGNALKYAQSQREMPGATYPWFLKSTKTITTVSGTQSYTIPTGYIQDTEERDGNLYIYSSTTLLGKSRTIFLKKMAWKDAQEKFFGVWPDSDSEASELADTTDTVANGPPNFYALRSTSVYFYPTPDAVYTVNWDCWAAATTLSAGIENAWLLYAPWVLIGEAARKIGSDLENASAVAKANTILERANRDLFVATIHRDEAGRKRSMGSRL